jgi:O-acetyl-ADP-ribose deacetylase (regulator of RNase III)
METQLSSKYIKIINGDLLNATEDYIVHQCNCVSTDAKTLAKLIFDKYPYANSYKNRTVSTRSIPGTIEIFGDGKNKRFIINAYAQYYPGVTMYPSDNKEVRIGWFWDCLDNIAQIENIRNKTIAMPYNIGCGAGGGDWIQYYNSIRSFAIRKKIYITLYKID